MAVNHVQLNTTIRDEDKKKLQKIAEGRGWTVTLVVREALSKYLKSAKS